MALTSRRCRHTTVSEASTSPPVPAHLGSYIDLQAPLAQESRPQDRGPSHSSSSELSRKISGMRSVVTKNIAVVCCLLLVGLWAVSHTSSGYVAIFQAIRNLLPFLAMIALVPASACLNRR